MRLDTFVTFIDYSKAFDYVNHQFLYHKMLNLNINSDIYNCIKTLYENPRSCVHLNGQLSDWFHVNSGVRQGDSLSPCLFSIFINDLAEKINQAGAGVYMGGDQIALLMYADDIALISSSVEGAQKQLDVMASWCAAWDMKINAKKSEILHIRNPQKQRCSTPVTCGSEVLNYTSTYKYLGYYLNEHLSHETTVETLTTSAQRSFGRVVQLFKSIKNLGIRTFETLYPSYVVPIMNYGSAVWGFREYPKAQVLKNRVGRFYLGVNRFTPVAETSLELDWLDPKFSRWLEILRYKNRLVKMNPNRLPVKIFKWEESLNIKGWVKDLKHVLEYCLSMVG